MRSRADIIPVVILLLTCLALLISFVVCWVWPKLKRRWVRYRLSFGVKPPVPRLQPWKPHVYEPWYLDPGNVLAIIAVLCAFAIVTVLKLHFGI